VRCGVVDRGLDWIERVFAVFSGRRGGFCVGLSAEGLKGSCWLDRAEMASTPKRKGSMKSRLDQIFGRRLVLSEEHLNAADDDLHQPDTIERGRSGRSAGRPPLSARVRSETVSAPPCSSKKDAGNRSTSPQRAFECAQPNSGPRPRDHMPISPSKRVWAAKSPRSASSSQDAAKISEKKVVSSSDGVEDASPWLGSSAATPSKSRGGMTRRKTAETNKSIWKFASDDLADDPNSSAALSFASHRNNSGPSQRRKDQSGRLAGRRFNSFQIVTERIALFGASQDSRLLSEQRIRDLISELPPRVRATECVLVYSLHTDKRNIKAFFRKVAKRRFTLILLRDHYGAVFGSFSSSIWRAPQIGYYGTDDCLLFQAEPTLEIYRSTGVNELYQLSTSQYVALGGGRDFGLFIDGDFQQGRSCACDTYGNKPLSKHKDFDIVEMEVWAFKLD